MLDEITYPFPMGKYFHPIFYWACDYLSTMGIKLIHVSKKKQLSVYSTHWNGNVVILTKFFSRTALEAVKMTTSSATTNENLIKMIFPFQCIKTHVLNYRFY